MSLSLVQPPEFAWPAPRGPASLADQLLALRRRWLTIVLCALLVPALAGLVLSRLAPQYTAAGDLLYDPVDAAPPGVYPADMGARIQDSVVVSQSAIITSLPAARELAARLNFAARPDFNPALRHHLADRLLALLRPAQGAKPDVAGPDDVATAVRQALDVSVPPNSDVLSISFTAADPALAAAAVNLAMQIYLDHQRDQAFATVAQAQDWLQIHAGVLQAQLNQTESALAAARAAAGVVSGTQASITAETASQLAAQLVGAKADLAEAQSRLASAANGDAAAANAAIAPNVLPLRKEAADLQAQIDALAGKYGPAYPELAADRAQLAAISGAIGDETGRELDAARADVAADQARILTLAGALGTARVQSQSEDAQSAPIRALEQREAANRDMLHDMAVQADQLAQQAALTKTDARILSLASPPDEPGSQKRALVLAAAGVLGVCLGLLLAGLADALDTSFRSGGDLRADTGLACLAVVPETRRPYDAALDAPFSLFAEQLRALRTALNLAAGPLVVAITAARPSEGKTTLSIALARALAASGLAVAAVDGDVRQPSFDAIFRVGGAVGLTDYLAGLTPLGDILQTDARGSLKIIPVGTQGADALSLFLSPALPALLNALRASHDVVLLDVPPAFALAEARVLARLADVTLLCVRWGHTPRRVVRAAIVLLREARVNVVGAALTRVNPRQHRQSGFPDAEMYQPRFGGYFRG